jgi:hypothetical protein
MALCFGAGLFLLTGQKAGLPDRTAHGLAGEIEVKVWPKKQENSNQVSIRGSDVLPLQLEDEVRLIIDFTYSTYPYVIWIDSVGQPTPVYPWQNRRWDRWPEKEFPTRRLDLPDGISNRWPTKKGPAGLETLLVLARSTPLPRSVELKRLLPPLDPIPLRTSRPLACFYNWELIKENRPQDLAGLPGGRPDDARLLTAQQLLKTRVGEYFDFSGALVYGFAGSPH